MSIDVEVVCTVCYFLAVTAEFHYEHESIIDVGADRA